jgi:hypothetical protein
VSDTARTPRRARLYVTHVNAWSITKAAFMLALAIGIVLVVAVTVLWLLLNSIGVFDTLTRNVNDVIGNSANTFDLVGLLSFPTVIGASVVIASVEIVLISIFAGLFAVMYNLSVGLTGGIEVVLSDDLLGDSSARGGSELGQVVGVETPKSGQLDGPMGHWVLFDPVRAHSSAWLERFPDKEEVGGSSPPGPT